MSTQATTVRNDEWFRMKPYQYGLATMAAATAFYLGLITLTSDWYNAKMQFSDYRWWLIALAAGLGIQVTLYATLRRMLSGKGLQTANTSVAASGGMSTAAMAVCCSHYLATFLPLIGLPFLSAAAAGLESYQVEFFAAGVIFNILGVGLMLRQLKKKREERPLRDTDEHPLGGAGSGPNGSQFPGCRKRGRADAR